MNVMLCPKNFFGNTKDSLQLRTKICGRLEKSCKIFLNFNFLLLYLEEENKIEYYTFNITNIHLTLAMRSSNSLVIRSIPSVFCIL